jgi:flagellar protein FlaJ
MKFHIPLTRSSIDKLRKKPRLFDAIIRPSKKSSLQKYLDNTETGLTREEYLNICYRNASIALVLIYLISLTIFVFSGRENAYLLAFGISLIISFFILFNQLAYPKLYSNRKDKDIEKNLIPALEDMLVQLNSGIPLFNILVGISVSDYGVLSEEFKKIVRKINAGYPQIEVLEEIGEKSSSLFFRRTLWQISNGMKAGSDVSIVIKYSLKTLGQEQIVQIQNYGNKLNPLIMFYMLTSIILPALAITFLTIISSLINLAETTSILLYVSFFFIVVFIQIMFLGIIKSTRPSLI